MTRLRLRLRDLRISDKIILPLFVVVLVAVAVTAPVTSRWIGQQIEKSAEGKLEDNRRAVELIIRTWEKDTLAAVAHVADESRLLADESPELLLQALSSARQWGKLDFASVTLPDGRSVSVGTGAAPDDSGRPSEGPSFVETPAGWALQSTRAVRVGDPPKVVTVRGGRLLATELLGQLREAAGADMSVALSLGSQIIGTSEGQDRQASCNTCHARYGITPGEAAPERSRLARTDMRGTPYLLLHTPFVLADTRVGTYTVLLPLSGVEAAQKNARNVVYGAGVLLFLLITGVEVLVSRSITKPIAHLAEVSQDIAAGNLSRTIEIAGRDEVGRLSTSMATMTQHLAGQLQELALLHQVSLAANSSLDLDDVLATLMESAVKVLDADGGSIMLLDHTKERLVVRVARGRSAFDIVDESVALGEGPAGWVALHRQPLLLPDDLEGRPESRFNSRPQITSSVSVPIETREGVLGVLNLNLLTPDRRFDRHTLTFAGTLANHTAMAIDKARHHQEINLLYSGLIRALASTIDAKDRYTFGHSEMVARYAALIGEHLGLSAQEMRGLETAAYLHDIGKIGVRDAVLTKPAHLTPIERQVVETHPVVGAEILEKIVFPWPVVEAVRHHHEHWDGSGYPLGLAGSDIPLGARILSVADSFDAMTSNRPYRKGLTLEKAIEEIVACAGAQFDPRIVAAFLDVAEEAEKTLLAARREFPASHTREFDILGA